MPNPYAAVARTYPQRLLSSWGPPSLVVMMLALSLIALINCRTSHTTDVGSNLLFAAGYLIALLTIHLKQLAIDGKGRLLPRPMRAPLVVTGACAAIYLIGFPLLLNLRGGLQLLGSTALLWIWCAAVCHYVLRPSLAITAVVLVAYVAAMRDPSLLNAWLAGGNHQPAAWLLFFASILWLTILTRWLLQMTEESRGYATFSSAQMGWKATDASTEQTTRIWQDPKRSWWLRLNSPRERQMDRLVCYGNSASIFVRCRRWQVGGMQQYLPCVMALMTALPMAALHRAGGPSYPSPLLGTLQMPVFFALMMPALQHLQQWRTRAVDLLKPLRREDYLREMGLSLAIDLTRNLIMVFVVVLAVILVVSPGDLQAATVLPWLIITGLVATFYFGAIVWLLRYRSMAAVVAPSFLMLMIYTVLVVAWDVPWIQSLAVCIATILGLAGVWLARDAYRRWLLTDLG